MTVSAHPPHAHTSRHPLPCHLSSISSSSLSLHFFSHPPLSLCCGVAVVYYLITVVTPSSAWSCRKRYSQFEELHVHLLSQFPSLSFPCRLPPKRPKALVSHTDRHFIEERRILLEYYSRRMNTVKEVAGSTTFRGFFASDRLDALVPVPDDVHSFPSDAEITSVAIPYTRQMSDHILYHIELCNAHMRRSFSEWSVLKRFLQFHEMDAAIRASHTAEPYFLSTLPSPPSRQLKMVVDHQDAHFVEQRRVLLEHCQQHPTSSLPLTLCHPSLPLPNTSSVADPSPPVLTSVLCLGVMVSDMKKMITIPQVTKNTAFLQFCGVNT